MFVVPLPEGCSTSFGQPYPRRAANGHYDLRSMDAAKTLRISTYCLWGALLCLPIVGYWASRVTFGTVFVQAWLPGDDLARATYRHFLEQFGDDQILFLSWPGCTLDDPRLDRLTDRLKQAKSDKPELGIVDVQNSRGMLDQLTDGPSHVSFETARQRLEGIAIGADGSCFIAMQVADASNSERSHLISQLKSMAYEQIGVPQTELVLAGEPFQVHVIDRASRETMQYFVAPSSAIALLLAWLCLGRLRLTLLVFMLAGIGQVIGLALIAVFLGEMSAVMVVLPTLIFMLTLSAAIHLTNYYRDCGGEQNEYAGAEALALGFRPCALATLTTVFGFGSLVVSQLQPVWQFGSLASLGLLVTTTFLLSVFPAALSLGRFARATDQYAAVPRHPSRFTAWLTRFTSDYANLITAIGLSALSLTSLGLIRLQTSTEFEDMFPASSPAVTSLRWMQEHLGPINSLEFIISFPKSSDSSKTSIDDDILDRVRAVARAHQALEDSEHTNAILSAMTFLPPIPDGPGTRSTIRRAVLRRTIGAHLDDLQTHHLMSDSPEAQQWRLSARIRDLTGDNFGEIQAELRHRVETSLNTENSPAHFEVLALAPHPTDATPKRPTLSITGLRVVIEKAHFALLSDLGGSFVAAFLLIAPVMMIIVRSIRGGLLLMIPNVLPVALVFGAMGWLQIKLDVASILTASVALGIAVDDTLHFVAWFMRYRRQGSQASEAVQAAIANCARPMLHTSIICTGSMLPFFFSDFLPTSKFALLMILILSGAIIGDLVLLPAMLQSSIGKWLGRADK